MKEGRANLRPHRAPPHFAPPRAVERCSVRAGRSEMRSSRVGKGRRDPRVELGESNPFSLVHSQISPPGERSSTYEGPTSRIQNKARDDHSDGGDVR